jgi:hypothetical protein
MQWKYPQLAEADTATQKGASANHYSTITLVGVQAANLQLTDFHF